MYIQNYHCITAAGSGANALMNALYEGRDCSQPSHSKGRVCLIPGLEKERGNYRIHFKNILEKLWMDLQGSLSSEVQTQITKMPIALVFASTKGIIEDYIWSATRESIRLEQDPFQCIIDDFCQSHPQVSWHIRCNISNACSSTHVASEYIQSLFESNRFEFALLISADLIGPFVSKGFESLKIVSPTTNRPFSSDREGLQLGEAAAMILFSKNSERSATNIELTRVESHTEGASITRPSINGDSLAKTIRLIESSTPCKPDLIIAHGTGTKFNDLAEVLSFQQFFGNESTTPVTGTKWSIGHTLGASGAIDLIAGCEILKRQRPFRIQNTRTVDANYRLKYLTAESSLPENKSYNQILISSLGFGGVHAALILNRKEV